MSLIKCAYEGENLKIYNEGFEAGRDRERDEIMNAIEKMKAEKEKEGNQTASLVIRYVINKLRGKTGAMEKRKSLMKKFKGGER